MKNADFNECIPNAMRPVMRYVVIVILQWGINFCSVKNRADIHGVLVTAKQRLSAFSFFVLERNSFRKHFVCRRKEQTA